jgi:type I restriction enzyme, S subunit
VSELPKGWTAMPLGNIGQWGSGGTPKSKEPSFYDGDIPWIRSGDLPDGPIEVHEITISEKGLKSSAAKWVREDAVMIAMYGATIGRLGITTYPVTTNQAVAFCIPNPKLGDAKFIFWLLRSMRETLVALGQGGAQPNISQEILKKQIALIPPLPEQRRIVAKLDNLTGRTARAREELGRIPRLIKKYRESLITSALSGAWTGDGAKGGWTDCKAKELFTWSSGKFLPKSKQANGRIPVYGGNGINGTHDRALVDLPTIVVGRVGAQCGNVYLTGGPAWITDNAIFAQTISERVDPRFALLVLRHSNLNAQSGGTGQPYVNQDNLNDVEFCLPSLREQHSILKRIEAAFAWLDRVATEHANASRLLPKLDQAILAKAFRGELMLPERSVGELVHDFGGGTNG